MLMPRQKTPNLVVDTLDHGPFDLAAESSERGTLVCFYRGLHSELLGALDFAIANDYPARGEYTGAV